MGSCREAELQHRVSGLQYLHWVSWWFNCNEFMSAVLSITPHTRCPHAVLMRRSIISTINHKNAAHAAACLTT